MALYTFDTLTYVIIHNDDGYLQFNELGANTELETPHTVETFTDEDVAKARAEALGYVFEPPVDPLAPSLPIESSIEEDEFLLEFTNSQEVLPDGQT